MSVRPSSQRAGRLLTRRSEVGQALEVEHRTVEFLIPRHLSRNLVVGIQKHIDGFLAGHVLFPVPVVNGPRYRQNFRHVHLTKVGAKADVVLHTTTQLARVNNREGFARLLLAVRVELGALVEAAGLVVLVNRGGV